VKFLKFLFSQRKSKIFISRFTFKSKKIEEQRIETKDVNLFNSLIVKTSMLLKDKKIEQDLEKSSSSITAKEISVSQTNTSIESISSISQSIERTVKRRNMSEDFNIKTFWDKRDERENFEEYLEDIEITYQTNYKKQKVNEKNKIKYRENVHKILFRQNLKKNVEEWYFDLRKTMKNDWTTLQTTFKTQFEIEANAETNKYLLLQRIAILNQRQDESIV
jgi:hypothetical protein